MASFVREVLSARGTLGDKEDFPEKIIKIQKKLYDLKSTLLAQIDEHYGQFSRNISDASRVTKQMEELSIDIETLNNNVNNHMKTQLGDCSKELNDLTIQITELSLSLQIVNKIKACYDAIEEGNEFVTEGKWLEASKTLATSLEFVRSNTCSLPEESINILPALKLEMIGQQQKLMENVASQWKKNVVFSQEDDKKIVLSVMFVKGTAEEVIQTLHFADLLDEPLIKFSAELKEKILEPILSRACSLNIPSAGRLELETGQAAPSPPPLNVFKQIKEAFRFICISLEVELGRQSLVSRLSPLLSGWLCDQLVRRVLAPAVPDTPDLLHTYQEVVEGAEQLQDYLATIRLLPAEDTTLTSYAGNVESLFASKLCENLLYEGREIMKQDLFLTAEAGPTETELTSIPLDSKPDPDAEKLCLPPNFPLPDSVFQFPACQVSRSALELLNRAELALTHASQAKSFCQVRLFHTVRALFSLWCAVTPTYHAASLSALPQLAALAHNSAMFLAHQLVGLAFKFRDKLPAVAAVGGPPSFVDLVPQLRESGAELLLGCMRLQRDQLKQILHGAGFPALATDRRLSSGAEQGVRQVSHSLAHLQRVWTGVLPNSVYLRCIGTLLNTALEELIQIVCSLEDISADAGGQLVSMLSQLQTKSPALFPEEDPSKFVKRWRKFSELIFILGASLREIEEGWGGGAGRLSQQFPAEQVKQLVRALFQNTERRAGVLARIK